MTKAQFEFLLTTTTEARAAGHPWPEYAACEAALESTYGESRLAREANNLFGMKAHHDTPPDQVVTMATHEFVNGKEIATIAHWMRYATVQDCFRDRLATLQRLSGSYPHYREALAATSGPDFVVAVSRTWSTDPERAHEVLAINDAMDVEMAKKDHPPASPAV